MDKNTYPYCYIHDTHCPHCGEGISNLRDDSSLNQGENTITYQCGDCGKYFTITSHLSIDFESEILPDKCCGNCIHWNIDNESKYCHHYHNLYEDAARKCWREQHETGCKNFEVKT